TSGQLEHEIKISEDLNLNYYTHKLADINLDGIVELLIITEDNELCAIEQINGKKLWNYELDNDYNYWNWILEIFDDGQRSRIMCYTMDTIYILDGSVGAELWNHDLIDYNNADLLGAVDLRDIELGDVNGDGSQDIVMYCQYNYNGEYNYILRAINGEDGTELWCTKDNEIFRRISTLKLGDIASNEGTEIVFESEDNIYAIEGYSGAQIWSYEPDSEDWRGVRFILLEDVIANQYQEVLVYSPPNLHVLDGETGLSLRHFDVELGHRYLSSCKLRDIDNDGKSEIVGLFNNNQICVLDPINGTERWSFATGDYISHYEIDDIDNDGWEEVIVVANNRLYAVEYHQEPNSNSDETWFDENLIPLSSIVLPLIIMAILIVVLLKVLKKRR
ncbi:MAG: PQQ-binding-like beta-propeller repeat protein, partial [Thermoplasmata archaeon]|nr:PQQ-binding-like beta-propeller repeat protein [Thermoplasmata archaeon]